MLNAPVRIKWRFTDPSGLASLRGTYDDRTCGVPIDGDALNTYWWDEGNGACDCNRAILFLGMDEHPCGEDRFVIEQIEPLT